MKEKKRLNYLNPDASLVQNRLGGMRHLCGVLEAISEYFTLTVTSPHSSMLKKNKMPFTTQEISPSMIALWKFLLRERGAELLLVRKNAKFLVAFFIFNLLRRKKNWLVVIELNALAGDYRLSNKFLRWVLFHLEVGVLKYFDWIYCVNYSLKERIISKNPSLKEKILVCGNGAPRNPVRKPKPPKTESVTIIYMGSAKPHYNIEQLAKCVDIVDTCSGCKVEFLTFGAGDWSDKNRSIKSYPNLSMDDISQVLENKKGMVWGSVPLAKQPNYETTIEPIKFFDYLALGVPVIASDGCLCNFPVGLPYLMTYEEGNDESLCSLLGILTDTTLDDYIDRQRALSDDYPHLTWDCRLRPLISVLADSY